MVSRLRRNSFNSRYIPSYVTRTTHLPYSDRVRIVYPNLEDNTILGVGFFARRDFLLASKLIPT